MSGSAAFEANLDDVLDLVSLALDESCATDLPDSVLRTYDQVLCALARSLDAADNTALAGAAASMVHQNRRALVFLHKLDWQSVIKSVSESAKEAAGIGAILAQQRRVSDSCEPVAARHESVQRALRASDAVSATEALDTGASSAGASKAGRRTLEQRLVSRNSALESGDRLRIARQLGLRPTRASAARAKAVCFKHRLVFYKLPFGRTICWSVNDLRCSVLRVCGELPYGARVSRHCLRLLDSVVASSRPFGLWRHGASHVVRDKYQQVAIFEKQSKAYVSAALILREMCVDAFFAMSLVVLETCACLAYTHSRTISVPLRYRFASVVQRLMTKWVGVVYERVYRQTALLTVIKGSSDRLSLLQLDAVVRRMPRLFEQEHRSASDLVSNFAVGLDKAMASAALDDDTSPIIDAASAGLRIESHNLARHGTYLSALISEPKKPVSVLGHHLFDMVQNTSWRIWHTSVPFLVTESVLLEHNAVHHIRAHVSANDGSSAQSS